MISPIRGGAEGAERPRRGDSGEQCGLAPGLWGICGPGGVGRERGPVHSLAELPARGAQNLRGFSLRGGLGVTHCQRQGGAAPCGSGNRHPSPGARQPSRRRSACRGGGTLRRGRRCHPHCLRAGGPCSHIGPVASGRGRIAALLHADRRKRAGSPFSGSNLRPCRRPARWYCRQRRHAIRRFRRQRFQRLMPRIPPFGKRRISL